MFTEETSVISAASALLPSPRSAFKSIFTIEPPRQLFEITLLILPGFFTAFLGLLLLLPPVQKHLTMKLLPHLRFSRMPGGGFSSGPGDTFEGEYQRKDEQRDRLDH